MTANSRELFRYEKNGTIRIYSLRVADEGAELWVVSLKRGKMSDAKKKVTPINPEDETIFLEDVERTLRIGGWRPLAR